MSAAKPLLMGILNVTPDSFSDGGLHFETEAACAAGLRMIEEGADIVDVGGESTRPGAEPVPEGEELRRVMPVVEALARAGVAVSIDTTKAAVARQAAEAGARIINDVSALRDPELAQVASGFGCAVCLMHMLGDPRTMQRDPVYGDIVEEVLSFLLEKARIAHAAGISKDRIWIDPGIGFGKTVHHNLLLLKSLDRFVDTGYPVLIGVSRKSFIGKITGAARVLPTEERLEGTLAAQVIAQTKGAAIVRAHDVRAAKRAIELTHAILNA